MYCVMRASAPSPYNVYRRYDDHSLQLHYRQFVDLPSLSPFEFHFMPGILRGGMVSDCVSEVSLAQQEVKY